MRQGPDAFDEAQRAGTHVLIREPQQPRAEETRRKILDFLRQLGFR